MYCSSCGVAVTPGLTYCNYCGAKLSGVKGDKVIRSSEVKPELLVSSMVATFVLGLGAITVLIGVLKAVLELNLGLILGFTLLCFLIMLSIEGVLVRLLFRRQRDAEEVADTMAPKAQTTRQLDAAQPRALPEPMPSVTEHTTRAFDPSHVDQSLKHRS